MSTSLVYRSALGYELLMRALYGRHYAARMRAVAEQVPPGASVLELCCGPGTLYLRHLRSRAGGYIGVDVNPGFVARLKARGVDARRSTSPPARSRCRAPTWSSSRPACTTSCRVPSGSSIGCSPPRATG